MPRVDPRQVTGGQVQSANMTGDKGLTTVLLGDRRVEAPVREVERATLAPVVAIAPDCQAGHQGRAKSVPHGIHEGKLELVAVQRVVEEVTTNLVRRLQHAGHNDPRGCEGEWRQQIPLQAGGQGWPCRP